MFLSENICLDIQLKIFVETEAISLRTRGFKKGDLAAGLIDSIARRVAVMAQQAGLKQNVAFVGVAKNAGTKAALEKELVISLYVPSDTQVTGTPGAALIRFS